PHPSLSPSFPTRRSSDLAAIGQPFARPGSTIAAEAAPTAYATRVVAFRGGHLGGPALFPLDDSHSKRVPSGTSLSGTHNATRPCSSWKPVTRHSDINGPICLGGKLTTPTTRRPTRSSGVYNPVSCALAVRRPLLVPT